MEPVEPKIRFLASREDPLFEPALALYEEAFPDEDEREDTAEVAQVASGESLAGDILRRHVRRFAIAEIAGELAGLRYSSVDGEAGIGFLIYLAVVPKFRRSGLGAKLIQFGVDQSRRDLKEMGRELEAVVFECERPELAQGAEREWRDERLRYFARKGAVLLSPTYVQPPLEEGKKEVPLLLMAYPQRKDTDWPHLVQMFFRRFFMLEPGSKYEIETVKGVVL